MRLKEQGLSCKRQINPILTGMSPSEAEGECGIIYFIAEVRRGWGKVSICVDFYEGVGKILSNRIKEKLLVCLQ